MDSTSPAMQASAAAAGGADEIADRTSVITGRLKSLYRKTVLPVEKRFQYDYFYESPFLSDSEFDGMYLSMLYSLSLMSLSVFMTSSFIMTNPNDVISQPFRLFLFYSQAPGYADRTVQCR